MTRVFYDLEFLEDGASITLISIGLVTDDGREYYAVNGDLEELGRPDDKITTWESIKRHPWLMKNVVPHLPITDRNSVERWNANSSPLFGPHPTLIGVHLDYDDTNVKPRYVIANEVRDFIRAAGPDVELWANYGAYDHVALCWLWGRMIELPEGIPMWTNDLRQERLRLGEPEMPRQVDGEHNALEDARHNRDMARFLDEYAGSHSDGPMRLTCSGLDLSLDMPVDRAPFIEIKHNGEPVVVGYVHREPPVSNFNTAPGMVVTEWADDDDESP